MHRKLASIQRVKELRPIDGAEFIEIAVVEGWTCVVKKGDFAVGDPGVFFEIDAIPPDVERFRFLWTPKTHEGPEPFPRPEKFRIRTLKLRGQLSQGLLMPLQSLTDAGLLGVGARNEGDDLTAELGVGKYEPPAPTSMGDWRGPFPGVLPKTDEMRVQSVPEVLEELRGKPYLITEKVDGTSATFLFNPLDGGAFHACGRNHSIREGDNLYWEIVRRYRLDAQLAGSPRYAVQGEIVGPGIQKNPLGLKEKQLRVFNAYDLQEARHCTDAQMRDLCAALGLTPVEVIEAGDDFRHTQESLLALAEGKYPGTKNEREGVVIRSAENLHSPTLGGRLSFKAISNRYLLKEE